MKVIVRSSLLLLAAAVAPALASDEHGGTACATEKAVKAIAVLAPTAGNQGSGTVTFTQEGDKVHVVANVSGLKPGSRHGFHIHDFGDCSAPDATSAGGHFNPFGHPHAGPSDARRHGGDLGNVVAGDDGTARLDLVVDGISVKCGPATILGRGVVLHAQEDDLKTQPTGNAGARIACGAIGIAKDGIAK